MKRKGETKLIGYAFLGTSVKYEDVFRLPKMVSVPKGSSEGMHPDNIESWEQRIKETENKWKPKFWSFGVCKEIRSLSKS